MKIIVVIFACCLAVALADRDAETIARNEATETCRQELKLTEAEAADTTNNGCLLACVHKKVGYLNADGTINNEWFNRTFATPRLQEPYRKAYQSCKEKAQGDPCKMSFCLENTQIRF